MLTQEEIDQCREAFERFDKDGSGTIDVWELKATLNGESIPFHTIPGTLQQGLSLAEPRAGKATSLS